MKNYRIQFLALMVMVLFTGCSLDDDPNPVIPEPETYAGGIFVLNEGNFGSGNSTVSYIDGNLEEVKHAVFSNENSGEALGDTGQDIGFYKDAAFIVMNVSNSIEVVNRWNFKSIATIETGLDNPRKITFSNDKAYVTNWGEGMDPADDFVSVFDAATFSLIEEISVEEGPEEILSENGKVYVAHKGGWSFNNKISVIDAVSNAVEDVLTVGEVPNSMVIDNGILWVLSGGYPSYAEEGETAGMITKITTGTYEVVEELRFSHAGDHPENLNLDQGMVYFTMGRKIFSFPKNEPGLPQTELFEAQEVKVLYSFTVNNGLIYAGSANEDFTGDGNLYIYDALNGAALTSFETGINPTGIYFN